MAGENFHFHLFGRSRLPMNEDTIEISRIFHGAQDWPQNQDL